MSDPARWDTSLGVQEKDYQRWALAQSRAMGRDITRDTADYDLRGLFKSTGGATLSAGHFTDRFKKPNHPTFSSDSQFSNYTAEGGAWVQGADGRWSFKATPENLRYQTADQLRDYFNRVEPAATLDLPASTTQSRLDPVAAMVKAMMGGAK